MECLPLSFHTLHKILNPKRIVITGGPSTGKTSVIESLEAQGFFCIPELVRSLTAAEAGNNGSDALSTNPILSVKNPKDFNSKILEGRIAQYESTTETNEKIVFFDRGIPDVHAYMTCFGQKFDTEFERPGHQFRYDLILLMPPWQEIYESDNERFESYEESERIFSSLEQTYRKFKYEISLIPHASIAERTDFILNLIHLD